MFIGLVTIKLIVLLLSNNFVNCHADHCSLAGVKSNNYFDHLAYRNRFSISHREYNGLTRRDLEDNNKLLYVTIISILRHYRETIFYKLSGITILKSARILQDYIVFSILCGFSYNYDVCNQIYSWLNKVILIDTPNNLFPTNHRRILAACHNCNNARHRTKYNCETPSRESHYTSNSGAESTSTGSTATNDSASCTIASTTEQASGVSQTGDSLLKQDTSISKTKHANENNMPINKDKQDESSLEKDINKQSTPDFLLSKTEIVDLSEKLKEDEHNTIDSVLCPSGMHPLSRALCSTLPKQLKPISGVCKSKEAKYDEETRACYIEDKEEGSLLCSHGHVINTGRGSTCNNLVHLDAILGCEQIDSILVGMKCYKQEFEPSIYGCKKHEKKDNLKCKTYVQTEPIPDCNDDYYAVLVERFEKNFCEKLIRTSVHPIKWGCINNAYVEENIEFYACEGDEVAKLVWRCRDSSCDGDNSFKTAESEANEDQPYTNSSANRSFLSNTISFNREKFPKMTQTNLTNPGTSNKPAQSGAQLECYKRSTEEIKYKCPEGSKKIEECIDNHNEYLHNKSLSHYPLTCFQEIEYNATFVCESDNAHLLYFSNSHKLGQNKSPYNFSQFNIAFKKYSEKKDDANVSMVKDINSLVKKKFKVYEEAKKNYIVSEDYPFSFPKFDRLFQLYLDYELVDQDYFIPICSKLKEYPAKYKCPHGYFLANDKTCKPYINEQPILKCPPNYEGKVERDKRNRPVVVCTGKLEVATVYKCPHGCLPELTFRICLCGLELEASLNTNLFTLLKYIPKDKVNSIIKEVTGKTSNKQTKQSNFNNDSIKQKQLSTLNENESKTGTSNKNSQQQSENGSDDTINKLKKEFELIEELTKQVSKLISAPDLRTKILTGTETFEFTTFLLAKMFHDEGLQEFLKATHLHEVKHEDVKEVAGESGMKEWWEKEKEVLIDTAKEKISEKIHEAVKEVSHIILGKHDHGGHEKVSASKSVLQTSLAAKKNLTAV